MRLFVFLASDNYLPITDVGFGILGKWELRMTSVKKKKKE